MIKNFQKNLPFQYQVITIMFIAVTSEYTEHAK